MKCSIKKCKKKAQGEIIIGQKAYSLCFRHFYEAWTGKKLNKDEC